MKIAVIGCGGNGGVIAGILALNSHNVYCIEAVKEAVNVLNEKGLHIRGKKGNFRVRVEAYISLNRELGPFDIIILAVKSGNLRSVFMEAKEYLCNDGFIITIQNGIEILNIGREFPDIGIIAGAVGYNSVMTDFGEYLVTAQGGITVGVLTRGTRNDLFHVRRLFEPHIKIDMTENVEGILWSKLLIVCGVTGLGGAAGLRIGKLLKSRVARRLFYEIVTEGSLLARKLGIELEKLSGAINPEKFGNHENGLPLFLRYLLLKIVGMKYRKLKSNIHHSIDKGHKTEIDFINGALVRLGDSAGFNTPVNSELVRVIEEIENKKRSMDLQNLYDIWERVSR